jgi:hypothetical protein
MASRVLSYQYNVELAFRPEFNKVANSKALLISVGMMDRVKSGLNFSNNNKDLYFRFVFKASPNNPKTSHINHSNRLKKYATFSGCSEWER